MQNHLAITPIIITPGDPAGIGPEIALKALCKEDSLRKTCVLIGDKEQLSTLATDLGFDCDFAKWTPGDPLSLDKINLAEIHWPSPVISGKPDTANASLVIEAIETAVHLAQTGDVRGIVTCPIAKANLYDAGFSYPGHTEFLGALSNKNNPLMMLANAQLRVVPATIHIALSDVTKTLSQDMLTQLIKDVTSALQTDFGIQVPHIAICGVNPHAGEQGAMGQDEIKLITPAITDAQNALGKTAILSGPLPADSLFHPAKRESYDCIIGMYHDQVLIPVKTIDFHGTVNITLGLDFIRTSPDHGTAFDIAGKGLANEMSLINAISYAQQMAEQRFGPQSE